MVCRRAWWRLTLANNSCSVKTIRLASVSSKPDLKPPKTNCKLPFWSWLGSLSRTWISKSVNVCSTLCKRSLLVTKITTVCFCLRQRSLSVFKSGIWPKNCWTARLFMASLLLKRKPPIPLANGAKKILPVRWLFFNSSALSKPSCKLGSSSPLANFVTCQFWSSLISFWFLSTMRL